MADFAIRNNLKTQYTPAELAKLSRVYGNNFQNAYMQQQTVYGPRVAHPSGNRKHSLPQQLSMNSGLHANAVSEELMRQHRAAACLNRQGMQQPLGVADLERELGLHQRAQPGLNQGNGALTNTSWCHAGCRFMCRGIGNGGSPGSVWASNLDPNSQPFAPRQSVTKARATSDVGPKGDDLGLDFELKDDAFVETDSNANVVQRSPEDKYRDLMKDQKIRKIWENTDTTKQNELIEKARGYTGFKAPFLTPDNFPPLKNGDKEPTSPGSETDDESALKSKHCLHKNVGQDRKGSCVPTCEPTLSDDKFGLRALIKSLQETPSSNNDFLEEVAFVEKVKDIFGDPVYNHIEGPFSNQVVVPINDPYEEVYAKFPADCSRILYGHQLVMRNWPTDMLFFFFYMAAGEALQILAGNILISRGWRWSKSRNVWIAKADGMQPEFQSRTSESGFYQFFNIATWQREKKYFTLHYEDFADKITFSQEFAKSMEAFMVQPNMMAKQQSQLKR